ncbi:hypothetical protein FB451DRAFT_1180687 [Mycena latifolia]|nr:hypothetical protein FB451DRAFT_1180687 [Mycena latifolia]
MSAVRRWCSEGRTLLLHALLLVIIVVGRAGWGAAGCFSRGGSRGCASGAEGGGDRRVLVDKVVLRRELVGLAQRIRHYDYIRACVLPHIADDQGARRDQRPPENVFVPARTYEVGCRAPLGESIKTNDQKARGKQLTYAFPCAAALAAKNQLEKSNSYAMRNAPSMESNQEPPPLLSIRSSKRVRLFLCTSGRPDPQARLANCENEVQPRVISLIGVQISISLRVDHDIVLDSISQPKYLVPFIRSANLDLDV